jgi:DNA mismatch endonuclease (patch repair protein)
MDRISTEQRSLLMSRIRGKDTGPELAVRSLLHGMGFRFRLHRKDLPGTPDIVFVGRRKVIYVHGCFWHGHRCRRGNLPSSNAEFWSKKIADNKARDRRHYRMLGMMGWKSLVVWECDLERRAGLIRKLADFLRS